MKRRALYWGVASVFLAGVALVYAVGQGQPPNSPWSDSEVAELLNAKAPHPSSYAPVDLHEDFDQVVARMEKAKPAIEKRQADLLKERYDLADRPAKGVTMSRGKPIQEGVRAACRPSSSRGKSWRPCRPRQSASRSSGPRGFCLCRIPIMPKAGCCFPSITSKRSSSRKTAI